MLRFSCGEQEHLFRASDRQLEQMVPRVRLVAAVSRRITPDHLKGFVNQVDVGHQALVRRC